MAEIPSALAALQDRYRLERELGRGGMAVVYLAEDLRHERPVALKVLLPELAAALGPERFQREIKLAARLQHPHILGVHDSGETGGRLWFTMPFVEGESLRDRLRRERQLGLDDALRIAHEAASALDYAHRHGVIHRDIKPENILLTTDGDTLVADFGIARALSGEQEQLTQTGLSVGTPAYMSPEQAAGDKGLDARSDVYSLGAVLYEMLAGEPPFTGPTAQAIVLKRMTEAPPSVRRVRPAVPAEVDDAIRRALAPVPADRFASAAELAQALGAGRRDGGTAVRWDGGPETIMSASDRSAAPSSRRPVVPPFRRPAVLTLALGFLLGLGVLFSWRRAHAGREEQGTRVVAVLPFENLGDSADGYFADGVTDEVRAKLSRVDGLAVIARNSSEEYRYSRKRPEEIGRELGADYLLTATVRWSKAPGGVSRVRVIPELVDVRPGRAARSQWQEPFDAAMTDVFQVQAEIAGKVAGALNLRLADTTRRALAARPTTSLDAYDAYLQALTLANGASDPATIRRSIVLLERAVALDSGFVAAWSQLARSRAFVYGQATPEPSLAAAALEAAERARTLAPESPEAALALRGYYANVRGDAVRALAAAQAGLARAPNNVDLLSAAGFVELSLGRMALAHEHLSRAVALDPRSPDFAAGLGLVLMLMGRYDEARSTLDRALLLAPSSLGIIENRTMVELQAGDLAAARRVIREAPAEVDRAALAAYFGTYQDLYWVLDDSLQALLVTLPPSAFDGDRGNRAFVLSQTHHLRGQQALARAFADTAQREFAAQLRKVPDDVQRPVLRAVALAYAGRHAEAMAEGQRALDAARGDESTKAYLAHQVVRIYLLAGEPERALDLLEPLLRRPYFLTPGWLRIDPTFAPLKGNPRFERLIAGK